MSRLRPQFPWFRLSPYGGGGGSLADCSVDSDKLQDCAVSYQGIQNVTAARLLGRYDALTGRVQEIQLGTNLTFDSTDSELNAAGVAIGDCAVLTQHLKDSAVTTVKILDSAVTYGKIQNVSAGSRLLGRHDTTAGSIEEISVLGGLSFDTTNDALKSDTVISDCTVTSAMIINGAIVAADLADSSVDSGKIADSAVSYQNIQTVTASRLLGRHDTTDGVVEEITVTGGLSFDTSNDALTSDSVAAASLTVSGRSEFATAAEMNTATDTSRSVNAYYLGQSNYGTRIVQLLITDTTLATGDSQIHFFIPPELDSWDLVDADAAVATVSTSGRPTIQIRNVTDAADMLSVKITIDSGEKTSYTSDTSPVIDTANDSVVTGNEIAVDIDSAGTGTEGLNVILQFRHST